MSKIAGVVLSLAWVLLVLYPNVPLGVAQVERQLDGLDALVDPDDELVSLVGEQLLITGEQPESWVARNIPWRSDYDVYGNLEYWAHPSETILRGAGDCEDRAVLTRSLNAYLDQESEVVVQPGHVYIVRDGQAYFGVSDTDSFHEMLLDVALAVPAGRVLLIFGGLIAIWGAVAACGVRSGA
jgi:hypothetical protein